MSAGPAELAARLAGRAAADAASGAPGAPAARGDGPGFAERLVAMLRESDRAQHEAEAQARALAEGRGDVLETMLALSKAELSLRLTSEVRNRALEAYHEIMRMQV